jgi:hypothetical protein
MTQSLATGLSSLLTRRKPSLCMPNQPCF